MISGNFWDRPGRSYRAALLENIDQNSAYVMVYHYPKEGELINHRGIEISKALIVTSESEMVWENCEPPYTGYYISN
jgi:hypothetical protein